MARVDERAAARFEFRLALLLALVCEGHQPNEKVSVFEWVCAAAPWKEGAYRSRLGSSTQKVSAFGRLGGASPVENGVVAAEPSRGASLCLEKQPSTQEKVLANESQDAMNRAGDGAVVLDEPPRHGA
jgi:hypothetical protein